MMKRNFSLFVALCLIVGLLPAVTVPHAHAEEGAALTTNYSLGMGSSVNAATKVTLTLKKYDTPIYTRNTVATGYFNKTTPEQGTFTYQSTADANEGNYNAKLIWHTGEAGPTLYLRGCILDDYNDDLKQWRLQKHTEANANLNFRQYAAIFTGSTAPLKIVLEEGESKFEVYNGIQYQSDLTIESVGDAKLTLWTNYSGIVPSS